MKETTPSRSLITLRGLSNIVALVALLAGLDWLYARWTGGISYACSAASTLGTDAFQTVAGMGGLLVAIVGITLGGVRHPMTAIGICLLVFGLLCGALLANSNWCA